MTSRDKCTRSQWLARFNLTMTFVWIVLLLPSLLWWKNSILWVVLMSAYANIVGHWSSYQGSRAAVKVEESGDTSSSESATVSDAA